MTFPLSLTPHNVKILLVDDQMIIVESVRRMLASEEDIAFFYCTDSTQAFQKALEVQPTVILQDLMMPGIDGMTLLTRFRQHAQTKDIPIIILSTKEQPHIKVQSFILGANDYIVKLPDRLELMARVRYHSQSYIHLLERNEAHQMLLAELKEAADYIYSQIPSPLQEGPIQVDWLYIPSMRLGGDSLGYGWLNATHMAFYLIDVCGHGVGANLLAVSVMSALRDQTMPHINYANPADVLQGLNEQFPMEKYHNMYITIWYGVYNTENQTLTYCSGGHPPALLFTCQEHKCIALTTKNFVVGGMPDTRFTNAQQTIEEDSMLCLFSDGVYEFTSRSQPIMHFDAFAQFLSQHAAIIKEKEGLRQLLQLLQQDRARENFEDDFSFMKIVFSKQKS